MCHCAIEYPVISSLSELAAAGSSRVLLEHVDRLASQPGTVRLDAFTHCLVAKCAPEVIFIILLYFIRLVSSWQGHCNIMILFTAGQQ